MSTKIGFIGLGIMGSPMALNLCKAGHALSVYARRPGSLKPLLDVGATACASPQDLAVKADIVFICVSDTPDVEQVILGENGLLQGLRKGAVVVDMSTISPAVTRRIAEELDKRGVAMLDAPVSGGEVGAVQGTLSIMVGGKTEVFAQVLPYLKVMGKNVVLVGDHGAGQVAKACNQIVAAVTIQGVAEALTFARAQGVDAGKVREALMGGFAGSRILEIHGKRMLDNNFKPGFKARLHQKDLKIVADSAHVLGIGLPATDLVAQQMDALVDAAEGDLDSSALFRLLERVNP